jgi:dienelactone hydrolase
MNRRTFLRATSLALGGSLFGAEEAVRPSLLSYVDASGARQPVKTPADWQRRREAILKAMQEVMGPLPGAEKRGPLDVQTIEEADCGSYIRRAITYASEPGSRVPAYLLMPKKVLGSNGGKAAAVLCLHPTDNVNGCKVVVGLGGKANRQYASELAERGFVTLSPAYPQLADYQPDIFGLGHASGTMKAIWDNIRGLDLLASLPSVKPNGFGAIGHSLGGHNAVYTAVFDERVKAVVSSCGLDSYRDYMGGDPKRWVHGQGWCQDRYMPRLANYAGRLDEIPFDFDGMLAAIAPRKVFISAPLQDSNFRWQSVDRVVAAAREVYALLDMPDGITVEHPDCPHDFPNEIREQAYAFLGKVLGT